MSKFRNSVAFAAATALILPFAAGVVRAAEADRPSAESQMPANSVPEKAVPPPTMDSNRDGKADAWDRDANGKADAWDVNNDGKPDIFDDDGDGRPDDPDRTSDRAAPMPPAEPEGEEPRF